MITTSREYEDQEVANKPAKNVFYAWLIHTFTASGAIFGILAMYFVYLKDIFTAFIFLGITILIDAVDGTLARKFAVKKYAPIDGVWLDNIIDFLTFFAIPTFILITQPLVPEAWILPCIIMIGFASCYQFSQIDAKTEDNFFKGFPSYWNIAVFYLYYWQTDMATNVIVVIALTILTFIPIKYIYPSKLTNISHRKGVIIFMRIATLIWGAATIALLFTYPHKMPLLNAISIAYIILYFAFSIYRTLNPLPPKPQNVLNDNE
jgi:phosphatidylcholine synthase